MRVFRVLGLVVVILLALWLVWILSGSYNVAASKPHMAITRWLLDGIMDRSVKLHSRGIVVPQNLSSDSLRQTGASHFAGMCVVCHGAPGVKPEVIGQGLMPLPPELSHAMDEWSAAQSFWIVKHGIKFTGMPSFGLGMSDHQLWSVVAFLQLLPEMTPAQYRELTADAGEHEHPPSDGSQP